MSGSSSLLSFLLGKGATTKPTIPFHPLCSPVHSALFLYPQINLAIPWAVWVILPPPAGIHPHGSPRQPSWVFKMGLWVSWTPGTMHCCRLLWFLWGIIIINDNDDDNNKPTPFSVIFVWAILEANPCLRPQPHRVLVYSRKWLCVIL